MWGHGPPNRKRTFPETSSCPSKRRPVRWCGHCGRARTPLCGSPAASAQLSARHPARCNGPGSASGARLPPPGTGGPAAEIYRGAGRRFPGPPGARAPITGSHGGPGPRPPSPRRSAPARPRSPACPFFSIHADALRRRRRQRGRRRRRRPPGLAGGRGAGTFPRPAARAAHRRRCRRGPGVRPGQSGRAGRGGAAAAGGLVSRPGLPRLPAAGPPPPAPPPSPRSGDPAEPPRSRRTAAGQGPARRAGAGFALDLSLAPVPPRSGCQSTEREAGLAERRLLPRSRRSAPPPPTPRLPSQGT
ncbi:28S ribosomal protein S28, mitochondrial isoform X1 [Acinonyx jubatus]|uniref:28S ribosomal protein S28, mitochondrial isoform X1 n=1 Tax=Acinonyx jubatus TaxID=32536 RepID=A0ABM3NZ46_ACIJB|nr:28S ribosomal protein S28, mitochondrial isoform X1 [Acinonyx jubatus]XP_053064699.1 28S ribosomal protein S28, mitochondrial isoform X1 [Acinonyx jubatus]XP_053064700.1 28S ribosomal protein S28, mitochondrial isoform X1 [Acinonyx jubatus]XP_053064701.1 28S ribosomal protein S28, mitochondrial isoform X1 [Acinonyx jubatus]